MTPPDQAPFVPGHRLSAALFDVTEPILARHFPQLRYAAALIGHGSDVLGYDTVRSTDHDGGPRLQIVVNEAERPALAPQILAAVDRGLPDTVDGVPTELPGAAQMPGDPVQHHNSSGTARNHGVTVTSVPRLRCDLLGVTDHPRDWAASRWLTVPRQCLLEFTAGPVHRDDAGWITDSRDALAWYPHDAWLYLMSGRWQRIAQVEAFVGRAAEVGDDLGSRIIAAGIGADIMHLALLQHRVYAPYPKWLGTAFNRQERDDTLSGPLLAALTADAAEARQDHLVQSLLELNRRHNQLQVTEPVRSRPESFFDRPYPVIWSERIAQALQQAITNPHVARLPYGLGGIDEISNSTDALKNHDLREKIANQYE